MFLRRLKVHLKNQNWTAVWLDFLIVVFGVYVAIQMGNWNQYRIDRQAEREALGLLIRDMERDWRLLERVKDVVEHHVVAAGQIIDATEHGTSATADIEQAFTFLYLTFAFTPQTATYTGLRNGGNLDLVRNATLRSEIVDYYEVSQSLFKNEYVAEYTLAHQELHDHFWRYVKFRVPENPSLTSPLPDGLDWTTLVMPMADAEADIRFLNDLSEIRGRGAEVIEVARNLQQQNRMLQGELAEFLSR